MAWEALKMDVFVQCVSPRGFFASLFFEDTFQANSRMVEGRSTSKWAVAAVAAKVCKLQVS